MLLCRGSARRHQGDRLAVHRRRRRLWLCLGVSRPDRAQSALALPQGAGRFARVRARRRRLEAVRDHNRQRLRVPRARVRRGGQGRGRPPTPDQGRKPERKRLRRAPAADDPRDVLAPGVRALARHRTPHKGARPGGYRLRRPQDEEREMSARTAPPRGPIEGPRTYYSCGCANSDRHDRLRLCRCVSRRPGFAGSPAGERTKRPRAPPRGGLPRGGPCSQPLPAAVLGPTDDVDQRGTVDRVRVPVDRRLPAGGVSGR